MDPKELARLIKGIIERVEQFIPHYMENEEDRKKAAGGIAICILDQDGRVYGKMFGTDKIMMRERYRVAWDESEPGLDHRNKDGGVRKVGLQQRN